MRYFVDTDLQRNLVSICAEDGRTLTVKDTDSEAEAQVAEFVKTSSPGPVTVWVFNEEESDPFLPDFGDTPEVESILEWAASVGSPTLPAKPAGLIVSGKWVQDCWAFLCRYTGESMDPEPVLPPAPLVKSATGGGASKKGARK